MNAVQILLYFWNFRTDTEIRSHNTFGFCVFTVCFGNTNDLVFEEQAFSSSPFYSIANLHF